MHLNLEKQDTGYELITNHGKMRLTWLPGFFIVIIFKMDRIYSKLIRLNTPPIVPLGSNCAIEQVESTITGVFVKKCRQI